MVGFEVLCCKIDSQASPRTELDWWHYNFDQRTHEPAEPPAEVAAQLIALCQHYGLVYGAIDLAVTPAGEWVFFELNPNGQWGWLEGKGRPPHRAGSCRGTRRMTTTTAGPAEELAGRITAAGYRVHQLTAFAGDQRHRPWRIAVHGGPARWTKTEREQSPVAGVRQEAAVLDRLAGLGPVPEMVAHGELSSGAAYLVTVEAPGQPLTGAMLYQAGTANAAAAVLGQLGALAGTGAGPHYPGRHVFARHPDLVTLLQPASG